MTLRDFMSMNYQGRLRATNQSVYIASRNNDKYLILLYQLDGFYVEVFYHKQYNFISDFHAFDDTSFLEPFLDKIAIPYSH